MKEVDVLAVVAHRDDAELICGGTLLNAERAGQRTGILDLSGGESGTSGSAKVRGEEAAASAKILRLTERANLGLPDAGILNNPETREKLAVAIRIFRPSVVITHALNGRHPDHIVTAQLVRDACFVAGLAKVAAPVPHHRPRKILHAISFREDNVKPTFVVDISDVFEEKMLAVKCYSSQFDGMKQGGEIYPNGESLYDVIRFQAAHYGTLIRARYGEPFYTTETMRITDVTSLEVSTF